MIEINTTCCNKEMIELDVNYNSIDMSIDTLYSFICGECGRILYLNEEEMDDENLESFLEFNEDKLKDTKIYKEIKGEVKNEQQKTL